MNNWSYNPALLLAAIMLVLAAYGWVQNPSKDAQLLIAARRNSTNSIQALVLKGADVNTWSKGKGATPLMIAARFMIAAEDGNQEAVETPAQAGCQEAPQGYLRQDGFGLCGGTGAGPMPRPRFYSTRSSLDLSREGSNGLVDRRQVPETAPNALLRRFHSRWRSNPYPVDRSAQT